MARLDFILLFDKFQRFHFVEAIQFERLDESVYYLHDLIIIKSARLQSKSKEKITVSICLIHSSKLINQKSCLQLFYQKVFLFLLDILFIIWDLNKYQYRNQILHMDEFFTDGDYNAPQITEYQPPQFQISTEPTQSIFIYKQQQNQSSNFDFAGFSGSQPQSTLNYNQQAQNDFNDFQEDETTKRIREQEQRIQNQLRQKSQKQWNDKKERVAQGCRQLAEFQARKEQEKQERAKQNFEKEQNQKQQYNKLKVQEGWHKVIYSINVRQGEYKGKKDTNRMRQAILHRRQDQSGK